MNNDVTEIEHDAKQPTVVSTFLLRARGIRNHCMNNDVTEIEHDAKQPTVVSAFDLLEHHRGEIEYAVVRHIPQC